MNLEELTQHLDYGKETNLELIDLFIMTGTTDVNAMKIAIEAIDNRKIAQSAHSLKGAAGSLGLMEICRIARVIEENARKGNIEGIDESVQSLERRFERIKELAEEYRLLPSE